MLHKCTTDVVVGRLLVGFFDVFLWEFVLT